MIRANLNLNPACNGSSPEFSFRRRLIRLLWIILSATIVISLIFFALGYIRLSQSGVHLLMVFIYSACIATLSMMAVPQVSVRCSSKFPRTIILIQALSLVCTAVTGSLAADLIFWVTHIIPRGLFQKELQSTLPFSIVITLTIGLGISTYERLRYRLQATELALRTKQMEQERANKLLAEAQLSSLESHIHPHFLFNTLNSIAALIPSDPQRAEDTVSKLASLLRFSLNASHSRLVPLAQELKIVRDFLEIETTRLGQRLRYEILVPEPLGFVRVPPLSLQTLVENAVKHVAAARLEGASIQITGLVEEGCISLEVSDDGPGFSLGAVTPEHGLGNLAARLALLFEDKGRLDVMREQERTIVRICFPAES